MLQIKHQGATNTAKRIRLAKYGFILGHFITILGHF